MKWIKANERLPEILERNYIVRQKGNSRSAHAVWWAHVHGNVEGYLKLALYDIEWLDEAESSTTADASVLTPSLYEALEALCDMWNQYCGGEVGHMFMSAGENCADVLDKYRLLKNDNGTGGEVDYDRLKELAQYSTQSPSSIEESGLKEGEVTCVFCEQPCEPAPTKRGWSSVRPGKGLHFDCAGKVVDQGNAIGMKELEDLGKDPLS